MMENPFAIIEKRIDRIESILLNIQERLDKTDSTQSTGDFLTVDEAAAYLNISKSAIYEKTSSRSIPHLKKGKRLYFVKQELADWVKTSRQRTIAEIEAEPASIMVVSKSRRAS
ncbi:helix-turn-helix domain-containing protein [Pontibacter lucknowensis]|uniref:DNA binding domain-containing protein, excisionase family n=1 Tax=Pontibacter lucknowensis TaxID=1077936 RepID=A0A1N6THG9_9BACT|nr:helix-turn-helix domain-containing protein [Pontibacter lucknowensis]SIQ52838.1 DNA binding domain-containing protein, excisionase family [Pontibacter lucknowensis]